MSHRESETLELKKSTAELKEAVISISAILNKHGQGTMRVGESDKHLTTREIEHFICKQKRWLWDNEENTCCLERAVGNTLIVMDSDFNHQPMYLPFMAEAWMGT